MEKNELSRKYELMIIVDAALTKEQKEDICKHVVDAINKTGGKVINTLVWLEKHKFTFDIKKCKEGTYYLINFESDSSANKEIEPTLKLNEKILRFSITKANSKPAVAA